MYVRGREDTRNEEERGSVLEGVKEEKRKGCLCSVSVFYSFDDVFINGKLEEGVFASIRPTKNYFLRDKICYVVIDTFM